MTTVAIIGGGPAGVISLDTLAQENKFSVTLFDCKPEISGTWVYDQRPPPKYVAGKSLVRTVPDLPENFPCTMPAIPNHELSLTYESLETNVEADVMKFTNFAIPETRLELTLKKYGENSPFRHHLVIRGWLQQLAFNYQLQIQLNTTLELAEWHDDHWVLTLRRQDGTEDYWYRQKFDKLLVALGKYVSPFVPQVPGLDLFTGLLEHSQQFRNPESYRGKKVIVVGGSISAMDLIYDVLFVAKKTLLLRTVNGSQVPVVGSAAFDHPDVDRRGKITKVDGLTVYFDDGSTEPDVDCILYGTGYTLLVPFLPKLDTKNGRFHGVYQHVISIENHLLAFVGFVVGGLTFKVFEWQAVLAARTFAGRASLPLVDEMKKWEEDRLVVRGDTPQWHVIQDEWREYFEAIRGVAGSDGPGRQLPPYEVEWEIGLMRGYGLKRDFFTRHYHVPGGSGSTIIPI